MWSAILAQLGERQTEDLKVLCSIHRDRTFFCDIMASPYSSIDAKALSPTNNTTTITFLFYLLFFHRLIGERRRQWRWKTWRLFIFTSYFGLLLISFLNSPFPNQNFRVVVIPNAHFFISFAIAFWDGVDTCEIFAASLWTIPYLR